MQEMRRPKINPSLALLAGALFAAATAGALISVGVASAVGSSPPARTVTVNVGAGTEGPQGPVGPEGPRGPKGPAGDFTCSDAGADYAPGILVINHPGGHVRIFTCLQKP